MAGYIEDRWLKKRPDKVTGKRERTAMWGKCARYRVKGIPGVAARSFDTSEDAKTWLATAQAEVKRGDFVDPRGGDMLLAEYIEERYLTSRSDEPSTARQLGLRVYNHIIPLIGAAPLGSINAHVLREYIAELLTRVEASTAQVIWFHLKAILNAAVEDDLIRKNPCNSRTIKPPKPSERKAKAWPRDRVAEMREHLQPRYRILVDEGVALGLRQSEALALALEDLDFEKHVVHVRRQLLWDYRARPYFWLPKGQKVREVPMSPNFERRMKDHIAQFPPVECTLPWRNPEPPTTPLEVKQRKPITVNLLVTTSKDNRVYYVTFNNRSWKPALAAVGAIKVLGYTKQERERVRNYPVFENSREDMFHVLRHTFASVQLEAGESIVSVSKWLGHSTPNITLGYYAHFMPEAGRRGMAVMDAWLDDAPEQKVPEKSQSVG